MSSSALTFRGSKVERESQNIGHGAESTTDLYFLRGKFFLNIKVFNAEELSVNFGFLIVGSDSHLFIAVSCRIHLNYFSNQSSLGVSWIYSGIKSVMGIKIYVFLPKVTLADVVAATCTSPVEHIFQL